MEKLYNDIQYAQAAVQASEEGKFLYIYRHEVEYPVEVLEWTYNEEVIERQKLDEYGNGMVDRDGDPLIERVVVQVKDQPIMIEEEVVNPETGETEMVTVQKHHTETRTKMIGELLIAPEGFYICQEGNITDGTENPEYDAAAVREARFKRDFFLVEEIKKSTNGYYRKRPEGYASAIESLNAAYIVAKEEGGVPANTLIFYAEPDFSEDVTAEWLAEHQIALPALTFEKFMELYAKFIQAWNTQEHIK